LIAGEYYHSFQVICYHDKVARRRDSKVVIPEKSPGFRIAARVDRESEAMMESGDNKFIQNNCLGRATLEMDPESLGQYGCSLAHLGLHFQLAFSLLTAFDTVSKQSRLSPNFQYLFAVCGRLKRCPWTWWSTLRHPVLCHPRGYAGLWLGLGGT
jgi:hypothetical protein